MARALNANDGDFPQPIQQDWKLAKRVLDIFFC